MKRPDGRPLISKKELKETTAPTRHSATFTGVDDELAHVVGQIALVDLEPLRLGGFKNQRRIDRIEITTSDRDVIDVLRHSIQTYVLLQADEGDILHLDAQKNDLLRKNMEASIERRERWRNPDPGGGEKHTGSLRSDESGRRPESLERRETHGPKSMLT